MKKEKRSGKKPLLSVIVPAYKEEKMIEKSLRAIEKVLKQIRYDYEIICVVDGNADRTYKNARRVRSSKLKIFKYKKNKGKGYAVRYGMVRAKGDLIAFIDAGMDLDPNGLSMLIEHLEWYNADVIIGSKRHPASEVYYPFSRLLLSVTTQMIVLILFGLKIRDTQVGLKIFRREVLEKVLPRLLMKRWAFDVELLVVARNLGFKKIYEAPVKLSERFTSNVKIFGPNGIWKSGIDVLAIFYRLYILRYYSDSKKRIWQKNPELNFKTD